MALRASPSDFVDSELRQAVNGLAKWLREALACRRRLGARHGGGMIISKDLGWSFAATCWVLHEVAELGPQPPDRPKAVLGDNGGPHWRSTA